MDLGLRVQGLGPRSRICGKSGVTVLERLGPRQGLRFGLQLASSWLLKGPHGLRMRADKHAQTLPVIPAPTSTPSNCSQKQVV